MDVESRDVESLGKVVRRFFRELFGSRVAEYLETEILHLREDFEYRLKDKDNQISALKEEKALLTSKVTMYEMTLMPHASREGAEVVAYQKPRRPNFSFVDSTPLKSRWDKYQEDYYKEEEQKEKEESSKKDAATAAKG